jgi:hypothetical protein
MSTTIGSGLGAQLGIATEATFGTPVATTRFVEFLSEGMALKRSIAQSKGLRAGAMAVRGVRRILTQRMAEGDVTFELPTSGFGLWLQHMVGSHTATAIQQGGSAAYQQIHNFGSNAGKSFTMQKVAPSIDGWAHPFTYPGCKVADWELTCKAGGLLEVKLKLDAADEITESQGVTPTTLSTGAIAGASSISTVASIPSGSLIMIGTLSGTIEYATTGAPSGAGPYTIPLTTNLVYAHLSGETVGSNLPTVATAAAAKATASYSTTATLFNFSDLTITSGGTTSVVSSLWTNTGGRSLATVTNVSIKGKNGLATDRFFAGTKTKGEQVENDFREISGDIEFEFPSRAAYDQYQADRHGALVFKWQLPVAIASTYYPTIQVYLPETAWEDTLSPQVSGPDIVKVKASFTALDDGTNGYAQVMYQSADTTV